MDFLNTVLVFLTPGDVEPAGDGPGDTPTSPSTSVYQQVGPQEPWNGLLRVHWLNGDATAYTRVYTNTLNGSFASATLRGTVSPGQTSFDTLQRTCNVDVNCGPGDTNSYEVYVTHYRDGIESAEVSAQFIGLIF
jgi:hypothetical protein